MTPPRGNWPQPTRPLQKRTAWCGKQYKKPILQVVGGVGGSGTQSTGGVLAAPHLPELVVRLQLHLQLLQTLLRYKISLPFCRRRRGGDGSTFNGGWMGGGGGEPAGPSPPVEGLARGPAVGVWANPLTHPGLWVDHISEGVGRTTGHSVGINDYVCGTLCLALIQWALIWTSFWAPEKGFNGVLGRGVCTGVQECGADPRKSTRGGDQSNRQKETRAGGGGGGGGAIGHLRKKECRKQNPVHLHGSWNCSPRCGCFDSGL